MRETLISGEGRYPETSFKTAKTFVFILITIFAKAVLISFLWNQLVADWAGFKTSIPAVGGLIAIHFLISPMKKEEDLSWEKVKDSFLLEIAKLILAFIMSTPFLILF